MHEAAAAGSIGLDGRSGAQGRGGVVTIEVGNGVPELDAQLEDADGNRHDLRSVLGAGPVLLGIYKSSCQASKTMFPFLDRLHRRYRDDGLRVLRVAQDSANISRSFARRLDQSFPILIEGDEYPVSRAFDIAATPTVFLIGPDGTVAFTTMGFFKQPVNELGEATAAMVGRGPEPLVTDEDADVPIFVPG